MLPKSKRKGENEAKWYCDVQDEKAASRKAHEDDEERKRKEDEEKRARAPPGMAEAAPETKKVEKKGNEEKTPEELEDEQAHLFDIDFVHEDIARLRRIEEIASRKALKEKLKGDDKGGKAKGGAGAAPKKPDPKDTGKDAKKDGKKDGKKDDKNKLEEKKEDVVQIMDIDLKKLLKIRVDHKYGQAHKILFHYDDESVVIIQIPPITDDKGKAFMTMVNDEKSKKEKEEKKKLDDYRREHKKHERAEKRKRIRARKEGVTYVPTEFTKKKPEPKVETDEEKRIIEQSVFYINNYKHIDGIWAIFNPDLKHFKFWGVQFQVKKTDEEIKKEKEDEDKKKKAAENPDQNEEDLNMNTTVAQTNQKKEEEAAHAARRRMEANEASRLKDDFIRNYSLSRLGLKLIFFIDYHITPQKDEKKSTITVNSTKFEDELFKKNYDAVTKFIGDILPDSTIVANFRKLGAIGLFRVYTYGFGENPEQEKEFFSNRRIKVAFPDIKKLYYALIDEFVKYDDLKSLENRQKEELHRNLLSDPRSRHSGRNS